ncbi:MAG: RDD family protein, partial [Acidobacteriota bacterium]
AFLVDTLSLSILLVLPASIISYGMAWIGGSMRVQIVWFVALGILAVYILLRDGYQGRSIGKHMLGLRLLTPGARPCGWVRSVVRNIPLLIPGWNLLEAVLVLAGRNRTGDRIARTAVTEE